MKLTEKQKHDPFYQMDRVEFKKLMIRYVDGEIIKSPHSNDIFGWNKEFKTLILAKKGYEPITHRNARSSFYANFNHHYSEGSYKDSKIEKILVIALSFSKKFLDKVNTDSDMEVINVTVEDLFKMDGKTAIPTIIAETIKRNTPLSRIFNTQIM